MNIALDLRFALRIFRRNPGFSVATILTFALGIGAAIAIFSVVNGVLLSPLPYRDPQQIVAVWEQNPATGANNVVSVATFEVLRDRAKSFSGLAALVPAPVTVLGDAKVERVTGVQASPGYFAMLGVTPMLGREFTAAESIGGAVILSNQYWQQHFGGDVGVIGRALVVDGSPLTIVGIMPADFDPPRYGWIDEQALWLPFGATQQNRSWGHVLHVVGRMRPDTSIDGANAELAELGRQLASEKPEQRGWSLTADSLSHEITGDVRAPLLLLLGGVLLLLLMAVTNVANLTLGFARRREQELSVRRALGASNARLARQLLTQSALLSIIGLVVGLAVANAGVSVLVALMPAGMPRAGSIRVDTVVLTAAVIATTLATLVIGMVAVFRGKRSDGTAAALVGATQQRTTSRMGAGALITLEIAVALVITVLAGLMLRSFTNLRAVDLGFEPNQVVAGRVALSGERYATADQQRQFFDQLLDRLRSTAGVQSASSMTVRPFRDGASSTSVIDPANPPAPGSIPPIFDIRFTDSGLFDTLRIPLVAGSAFALRENPNGAPHVILNQAGVRALNLSANALGRPVDITLNGGIHAEIIGVVGDVHLSGPRTPPRPTAYLASAQFPSTVNDIMVRGVGTPAAMMSALRQASVATDPMVPVYNMESLNDVVDESLARDRFTTFLLGAFSLTSLLLAGIGIFGVFAADVVRRRGEIGIRRALGAGSSNIFAIVLRRALSRAALGIVVGIVVALAVSRGISALLFNVGSTDLTAFVGVTGILLATAMVAAIVPAWRASRVPPIAAIRSE